MKLALALLLAVCVSSTTIHIQMNVFSGTEDPSWTVEGEAAKQLLAVLPTTSVTHRPLPWYRMGYSGFVVTVDGRTVEVYNNAAAERALLYSGINANALQDTVVRMSRMKSTD
jgi:hypothetical protein